MEEGNAIEGKWRSRLATTNVLKVKDLQNTAYSKRQIIKENLTEAFRAIVAISSGNPKEMRV